MRVSGQCPDYWSGCWFGAHISARIPFAVVVLRILPHTPTTSTAVLHGITLFMWTVILYARNFYDVDDDNNKPVTLANLGCG
jgi:hypothetical protein